MKNCVIIFGILLALNVQVNASDSPIVSFNRDIRSILSENCFFCHGQDPTKRKGGVRLDVREDAIKSKAIVPGDVSKSELITRVFSIDHKEQMPPLKSNRTLSLNQKEMLKRWISEGAKYEPHWAFVPPIRPSLPEVKNKSWIRNPIDTFILAKLVSNNLHPSPEADRLSLIRRVSLDLTGLPPSPYEVNAFLNDTSPNAYEKVVDRLMNSKHFGERMAQPWLDAARYADTSGYQSDGDRSMWRWRDWVIDAYNSNMRFDQFTIEQLAGDLLPGATRSQRLATGFNRNHRGNAEGGIVPEEYAVEYVVDRVDTTATVWLGLTMGCARCHDHKYDPVTQREFYQMFAFFNNVPENGRAIKYGNSPPMMIAPTVLQEQMLEKLDKELKHAQTNLRDLGLKINTLQSAWEQSLNSAPPLLWTITKSLQARFELAGDLAKSSAKFQDGSPTFIKADNKKAALFDGKRYIDCGDVGDFGFYDKFTLAAWVQPTHSDGAILSRMAEPTSDLPFAVDSDGYRVFLKSGRLQFHLTKRWLDDALRVETETAIPLKQWHHIAVVYDGSRLASGVKIFINGQPQKVRVLLDQLNQSFQINQPLRIGAGGGLPNRFKGLISDVRVYSRVLSDEEIGIVSTVENITELAAIPVAKRNPIHSATLRECYLTDYAEPSIRNARLKVERLIEQRVKLIDELPTVMVMEEMEKPRPTFVLKRGEYDKLGEKVNSGVPACLPPLPKDVNVNRLAFATWLVNPSNPLTSRVALNHQWQMIFGTGLVKTTEDFGSQGALPSHPELLDWLATEFVNNGWDVKKMIKILVMSATYRQSSRVSPQLLERDPENRLLARSTRMRLSAEMLRDQALAVSGLLVDTVGGPSVKPYQPKGLLKELSGIDYEPDHGENLWRRSLYTFWKRTSPQPTMMTFDASGREVCSVRQSRTSTPLQALALMNDLTFVEAARCLAMRVMNEGGVTDESRLSLAFRLVLTRSPKQEEMKLLLNNFNENLARFRANPNESLSLIRYGEFPIDKRLDPNQLAAYTVVVGLILNLDEAITKP